MSRNSIFQIGLLLVLTVIAVGIWVNRGTAPPQQLPAGSPFGANNFGGERNNAAPTVANSTQQTGTSGDANELLEAIKSDSEQPIRLAWINAMRDRNLSYMIQAFRLACKHGTIKSLRCMTQMIQPLSQSEEEQIIAGLKELLDRQQYDAVRSLLGNLNSLGLTREPLNSWVLSEFERQPWDAARFEAIISRQYHYEIRSDTYVKIIAAGLTGSKERFEWLRKNLDGLPAASPAVAISELAKSRTINASNVGPMLELAGRWNSNVDKSELFTVCLPFLKPEHVPLVRTAMKYSKPTDQLLEYVLKNDASDISSWELGNEWFRLQLHAKLKKAITTDDDARSLEPFASIAKYLIRECSQNPQWDVFARDHVLHTSSMRWLWKQGFRPRDSESLGLRLYLAIQCQDKEYLETILYREKRSLPDILNSGITLGFIAADQSKNDRPFVPLLAAIETCDLAMVQMLIESKSHNWKTWSFENPLAVALRTKRSDVYRLLQAAGVTDDVGASLPDTAAPGNDITTTVAVDPRELKTLEKAGKVLCQIAEAGDLAALEIALANFPFRTTFARAIPRELTNQLIEYEQSSQAWRNNTDVRRAIEKSVAHPKLFARLVAEGFDVDMPVLMAIVRDGHEESLKIALCDMVVRKLARENIAKLDEAAAVWPKVRKLLEGSGLF